ncbi:MAG: ATP-binding protein, partial [Nannocystaceae bacterium]
ARIADVCRVDEVLRVRLDGELDPGLTLVGQVRDSGGTLMRFDAPVEREMSVEGLGPTALEYGMAVVTPDQEIVDQRLGFIPASSPFEAARGEVGDVDLLQAVERMLDDGEDALCEYKAWVNPTSGNPKFDEIIRTVIAMSNSDGGTVLVGVDDAGVVTTAPGDVLGAIRSKVKANLPDGAEDDAEKIELEAIRLLGRKARDVIQQTVEPSVEVTPKPVQTPYGPILLLLVQRGQKPPYMHAKTKQFLVRRNATNRRANIEELRLLYLRRPGQ